jgi:hypothetical protein
MKTSELTGRALAYAVGIAEGYKVEYWHAKSVAILSAGTPRGVPWNPHTDWSQGGPIIEREHISIIDCDGYDFWIADKMNAQAQVVTTYGPTPLIAAMRCYAANKLGDEVEIPEELS